MGGSVQTGEEGFHLEVERLRDALSDAVDHLADLDAEDDLEAFARMLDALIAGASALQARSADGGDGWTDALGAALVHLREAHDLLDDGEPSDAVALEVMAAGDLLEGRLKG